MSTGVYIIAEAGINHNGKLKLAHQLIEEGVKTGADAIKFQYFIPDELVAAGAEMAYYQKSNLNSELKDQYELLSKYALAESEFIELKRHAESESIDFLLSFFDESSLRFVKKYSHIIKVPSGEITNIPLLSKLAECEKKVLISTGMSSLGEIENALEALPDTDISLLHCTSNYPAKFEDINLRAMDTLKIAFNLEVGYSDHTEGFEVAIAAVALGAKVIEKHFTLNKTLKGPDHLASLSPAEFSQMVESIRNIETSLGSPTKRPVASEYEIRTVARKSIVSNQNLKKGAQITKDSISVKRPGDGISPGDLDKILGLKIQISKKRGEVIRWQDFKDE